MSGDDKDDDITVVASHSAEYASSEPGSSPQRIKTGKPTTSQQVKSTTTAQPIPISQTLATAIQK